MIYGEKEYFFKYTTLKTNNQFTLENGPSGPQKETIVFQASIFRCELLVYRRVAFWMPNSMEKKDAFVMRRGNLPIHLWKRNMIGWLGQFPKRVEVELNTMVPKENLLKPLGEICLFLESIPVPFTVESQN